MSQKQSRRVITSLLPYQGCEVDRNLKISVSVLRSGSTIQLEYALKGDTEQILLPQKKHAPERKDNLWQHTCFEAFITWEKNPGYFELNLSPSGDWNFYSFDGYRAGQKREEMLREISHSVLESAPGIELHRVVLDLSQILDSIHPEMLFFGLTTVIEKRDGSKSYWAIEHRGSKPDFHIRESFSLVAK